MKGITRCRALVIHFGFAVQVATSTRGGPEHAITSDQPTALRASKDGSIVLPIFIKLHKVHNSLYCGLSRLL